jgi:hypothetical protein
MISILKSLCIKRYAEKIEMKGSAYYLKKFHSPLLVTSRAAKNRAVTP